MDFLKFLDRTPLPFRIPKNRNKYSLTDIDQLDLEVVRVCLKVINAYSDNFVKVIRPLQKRSLFKSDRYLLIKSIFEFSCLHYRYIDGLFYNCSPSSSEISNYLFAAIAESFDRYKSIFDDTYYKSFEYAFSQREILYNTIIPNINAPHMFELLGTLFMDQPLCRIDNPSEDDVVRMGGDFTFSTDFIRVAAFKQYCAEMVSSFGRAILGIKNGYKAALS